MVFVFLFVSSHGFQAVKNPLVYKIQLRLSTLRASRSYKELSSLHLICLPWWAGQSPAGVAGSNPSRAPGASQSGGPACGQWLLRAPHGLVIRGSHTCKEHLRARPRAHSVLMCGCPSLLNFTGQVPLSPGPESQAGIQVCRPSTLVLRECCVDPHGQEDTLRTTREIPTRHQLPQNCELSLAQHGPSRALNWNTTITVIQLHN